MTGFLAATIAKAALSISLCLPSNLVFFLIFIDDFLSENIFVRCRLTYHVIALPKIPLDGIWFACCSRILSSGYSKSIGSSTNTGPGTPDTAIFKALVSDGTMSRVLLTLTADFT